MPHKLPPPRPLLLLLALGLQAGVSMIRAQVRLTELLPVNTVGHQDQSGHPQPWIEIWNPSKASAVDLTHYRMVQAGNTWLFPTVHLMPDERLVIFASGTDQKTPTAPLHTSFTLPSGGGTVILQNASGSAISTLSYPALPPDVSWGRDEWDTASLPLQTGRYTSPTPGGRNNFAGAGVAGKVIFSTASMAFPVIMQG